VAKEGLPFVLGGVLAGILLLAAWHALNWEPLRVLGILALVFGAFSLFFFRDPRRIPPAGEGLVLSPADGKVVEIVREDDPYAGANATRVSIFLSVLDVHVNRNPISGSVTAMVYRPGKYLMAFNEKASADNEQTHIAIKGERGTVAFKQIAGFIARRIVCRLKVGDTVRAGDRCGLIRFGSRVDVIVPPDASIRVAVGQRAVGGKTVIGVLP